MLRVAAICIVLVLASCTAGSSGSPPTSLITLEDLTDPAVDIEGATGIVLPFGEPDPAGVCEAFDAAPSRWLRDALLPIQIWVGNFEKVDSPPELEGHVGELLDFGRARLRWNFTGGDRPLWEERHESAERALTEWAVANCELSPVIGPWTPGAPRGWADLTANEIGGRCADEKLRVRNGQEEFKTLTGRYAGHVIALETHLELFWASDYFYVTAAAADSYDLAPVPGGPCDSP